jgi:hypothetical protein
MGGSFFFGIGTARMLSCVSHFIELLIVVDSEDNTIAGEYFVKIRLIDYSKTTGLENSHIFVESF